MDYISELYIKINKNEQKNFLNKLKKYSTFNEEICEILIEILNKKEQEEYIYIKSIYKKIVQKNFYSNDININIITKKQESKPYYIEYYKNPYMHIIHKNPNIILIPKKQNEINFITIKNNKIYKNINFKNYTYLEKFIYELIEYRLVNNIENITKEQMKEYKENYLKNKTFKK